MLTRGFSGLNLPQVTVKLCLLDHAIEDSVWMAFKAVPYVSSIDKCTARGKQTTSYQAASHRRCEVDVFALKSMTCTMPQVSAIDSLQVQ